MKAKEIKGAEWEEINKILEDCFKASEKTGLAFNSELLSQKLASLLAKAKKEAVEEIKEAFVREFCNDHDPVNPPRWLRGVAFNMPDLLRLILEFFDGLTEKGEVRIDARRKKN